MENQHKMIKGYRDLSQEEIDLMNKVKDLAEAVRQVVEGVARLPETGHEVNIARTELQTGFMWLVRSIARPTTF